MSVYSWKWNYNQEEIIKWIDEYSTMSSCPNRKRLNVIN